MSKEEEEHVEEEEEYEEEEENPMILTDEEEEMGKKSFQSNGNGNGSNRSQNQNNINNLDPIQQNSMPIVLVLGSGYAGSEFIRLIQKKVGRRAQILVVDKRKASVHKIAATRAAVLGTNYCERVLIPNDKMFRGNGHSHQMIYDSIEFINFQANTVKLSKESIRYDFLVIATGAINYSICEPPLNVTEREDMTKYYASVHDLIKKSETILLVGGGPTGAELSAEIKYEYPSKYVTLVHRADVLLNGITPKPSPGFEKAVRKKLEASGVTVLCGEGIDVDFRPHGNKPFIYEKDGVYETTGKIFIKADLVLQCTGKRVSNSIFPTGWLDEAGQLKVDKTLRIENHHNIFAIGDVNNVRENKLAMTSSFQASLAAVNVSRLVKGKHKMKNYTPFFGMKKTFIFVNNGRKKGTGYMGITTVGDTISIKAKSKNLMTSRYWKIWGHKTAPKEVNGPSQGNKNGMLEPDQTSIALDSFYEQ